MKTPTPFSFDGHGINDAKGQRIAKIQARVFETGELIQDTDRQEFDRLSNLFAASAVMLEALTSIYKLHMCPEPKRMRDWSARCDVMADYARKAIAKAEGR